MYYNIIKQQSDELNKRAESYKLRRDLYLGNHYKAFEINQFEFYTKPETQYITYNYFKILTTAITNLIWSEAPELQFKESKNEKWILGSFVPETDFFNAMRRASEVASFSGDALLHLGVDKFKYGSGEDRQITLSIPDSPMWCPIFDPCNVDRRVEGHILRIVEKWLDKDKKDEKAFLLQIELYGRIEYEAYRQKTGQEPEMVDVTQDWDDKFTDVLGQRDPADPRRFVYETGCRYPLLFRLPNFRVAGEFYGESDYSVPVISKVYNLNQNLNQIQYVLRKHAHPKMVVPKEAITQAIRQVTQDDKKAQEYGLRDRKTAGEQYSSNKNLFESLIAQKILDKLEFFGTDINSGEAKYLTWDGNLNESREQIEQLKQALFEETQLAKVLIDPDVSLGQASGVAILRMAQPTFHERARKIDYLKGVMQKLIYTALELAGKQKIASVTPEYPDIIFKDGLVDDINEIITQTQQMLDSELISKIDAIAKVRKISPKQAEQRKAEIDSEAESTRQQFISDERMQFAGEN